MTDTLQRLADISVLAFVVLSMLAMGMSQRLAAVVSPLRDIRTVAAALAINFGNRPLLALALTRLVPLAPAHAVGLLLLGSAAGAPFLPKLVEIAGGNLAYSVALMVLQMVGTIVFMPLALPWLVPGLNADPVSIAMPLVILMLVPLAHRLRDRAGGGGRIQRLHGWSMERQMLPSCFSYLLLIGLNLETLAGTVGSFAIGTYALFVLVMVGLATSLAGEMQRKRRSPPRAPAAEHRGGNSGYFGGLRRSPDYRDAFGRVGRGSGRAFWWSPRRCGG